MDKKRRAQNNCNLLPNTSDFVLLFYQVLDNLDYFVGISWIDLSTGQ